MCSNKRDKTNKDIDDIAYQYTKSKKHDGYDGLSLLRHYGPMLKNIAAFLYYGNSPRGKVTKNLYNLLGGQKTVNVISDMLNSFDFEDIFQEIKILFLEFAKNFEPYKLNNQVKDKFSYYVTRYFHYFIKQEYLSNFSNVPLCTPVSNVKANLYKHSEMPELENNFFSKKIDDNWVEGKTCSEMFWELDEEDREILKDYYVDDIEVKQIAGKFEVHPSNIYRRLAEIENKINHN